MTGEVGGRLSQNELADAPPMPAWAQPRDDALNRSDSECGTAEPDAAAAEEHHDATESTKAYLTDAKARCSAAALEAIESLWPQMIADAMMTIAAFQPRSYARVSAKSKVAQSMSRALEMPLKEIADIIVDASEHLWEAADPATLAAHDG